MKATDLKGMGVALITPFDKQGDVDYHTLSQLIDFHIKNGTDYLVALGTTAETPTLSAEEQKEIVRTIVAKAEGKLPIVMGVGGNNTRILIERLQSDDFSGIDAVLSVVPCYNKPSQEGIYQHFKHLAQATRLPIILYNVPGRTAVNMTAETTLRLANDFKNIIGIKEASGDMAQITTIIRNKPPHFQVISGDDGVTFPMIKEGAIGVISVIANAYPREFGSMVHLALSGDYDKAQTINEQLAELIELLFTDGSPSGVKHMLNTMGYIKNILRLPLVPVSAPTAAKIEQAMRQLTV